GRPLPEIYPAELEEEEGVGAERRDRVDQLRHRGVADRQAADLRGGDVADQRSWQIARISRISCRNGGDQLCQERGRRRRLAAGGGQDDGEVSHAVSAPARPASRYSRS